MGIKTTQLPTASSLDGSETIEVIKNSASQKTTLSSLPDFKYTESFPSPSDTFLNPIAENFSNSIVVTNTHTNEAGKKVSALFADNGHIYVNSTNENLVHPNRIVDSEIRRDGLNFSNGIAAGDVRTICPDSRYSKGSFGHAVANKPIIFEASFCIYDDNSGMGDYNFIGLGLTDSIKWVSNFTQYTFFGLKIYPGNTATIECSEPVYASNPFSIRGRNTLRFGFKMNASFPTNLDMSVRIINLDTLSIVYSASRNNMFTLNSQNTLGYLFECSKGTPGNDFTFDIYDFALYKGEMSGSYVNISTPTKYRPVLRCDWPAA